MSFELLAAAAVAFAILLYVLDPLVRPSLTDTEEDDEPTPLDENESPRVRALLALRDVEFDRATGKLSDEDYQRLKLRYESEAVSAMRAEEAAPQAASSSRPDGPAAGGAEALIAAARARVGAVCPSCGPRPEDAAAFCSRCGRALAA